MGIEDMMNELSISEGEQEELLTLLLREEGIDLAASAIITHRPYGEDTPLSFAQQRLWFLNQLVQGSFTYILPIAMRLVGQLNVSMLERSLNEIIRRHEVLRTTFDIVEGQPVQRITSDSHLTLLQMDLRKLSERERETETERLITEEAQQPLDLAHGPLFKALLLQQGEEEYVLLLVMHHIISDGWSIGVLFRELAVLYTAYTIGENPALPRLPIQYLDYALWQRERLQGSTLEKQLVYWKQHLTGIPAVLPLPTDRPRPRDQTFQGAHQSFSLSQKILEALKAINQREGVTLFMTLLAAFDVLLYRYTEQEDLVVGTPIAGRTCVETENLIGFFVNTLPLRADLSGDPGFRELLGRVREVTLEAYAHQEVPFELLVKELQPERTQSYTPLFQVMFVLQNTPANSVKLPGLIVNPIQVKGKTASFDLTFELTETSGGLAGIIEYSTDLFEAETITRMAGHFQTLLEGIIADPEQAISTLPLLTITERQQLLVEWNATHIPYLQDRSIHQLFEEQVECTPEAIAVVFEEEQLTYDNLNRKANQLAHYLRQVGIGPEMLVGICMERSLEMIVSLLGILKAGGAYVPLDPAYPRERLAFMQQDAQISVLLTQQRLVERLPEHTTNVICLDSNWNICAQQSTKNPIKVVIPENLAYVIYTSGSTGQPKGITIRHCNTVAFIYWAMSIFTNEELTGVLASTSISFDLSIFEIFVPLSTGGTIILVENVLCLPSLSAREQVTLINTVPSAMTELISSEGQPFSAQTINFAGEPLPQRLAQQLYQQETIQRIFNLYGPSEDTTYSTYALVEKDGREPTIGRPIANTQVYILDSHLQPVPKGIPGELYIGGDGLARGYLHRPELTAERFIAHPFSQQPGARLYKTGDRVRYLPDGNLKFLGRLDHQVKIRGFRVELGEIEAVLNQHLAVQEAVVLVRKDAPGDERLVAYLIPRQGQSPTSRELYQTLKEQLPEYMVPAAFVCLQKLPLSPNGKLDSQALPVPEHALPILQANFEEPHTLSEAILAQIWGQVLGLKRVGIHDNFFELGGHSLLAIRLISRIHETFQADIPFTIIFKAPTISALSLAMEDMGVDRKRLLQVMRELEGPSDDQGSASFLNEKLSGYQAEALLDLARRIIELLSEKRVSLAHLPNAREKNTESKTTNALPLHIPRDKELPLSFHQERRLLRERKNPFTPVNVSAPFHLTGWLDTIVMHAALNEIIRRHEVFSTIFFFEEDQPVQRIMPSPIFTLPIVDLSSLPISERKAEVQRLAAEEVVKPFDLAQAPLLRVILLRLHAEEHVLIVTMDHMISDGWSLDIFLREMAILYNAFSRGVPSPLPELLIQYIDFAAKQRQLLQGETLETLLAYWRKQIGERLPTLDLPKDHPRPAIPTFRGASRSMKLSATLSEALKKQANQNGATLFMTLLAAFQTLVYRYTGKDDISVVSPVANRSCQGTEGLIGWFANNVLLRTDFSGNPSFHTLLERIRGMAIEAYTHQEMPFPKLAELLDPEIYLSPTLPTELFFNFSSIEKNPLEEMTGLSVKPVELENIEQTARSVNLLVQEEPEGLKLIIEYEVDLYNDHTITRMLRHLHSLLKGFIIHPELSVSLLPLIEDEGVE